MAIEKFINSTASLDKYKATKRKLPSSPVTLNTPEYVMGINVSEFLTLLQQKRGKDRLFEIVDLIQARMAFANLYVIEQIEQSVKDDGILIGDHSRLLIAIKTAMNAVNSTLASLGVNFTKRVNVDDDDEPKDSALQALLAERIDDNIPPAIRTEYISASADLDRAFNSTENEHIAKELVDEIKMPITIMKERDERAIAVKESHVEDLKVKELT